jgi:type IV secretion system protein VirB8
MKQAARESLDAYYSEAGSWAEDQHVALRESRRVAWIVATVAVVIALCEALALLFLMPFKTVVPYTLLVDKQTGYVQELKPLDAQKISPDTALTQSFLVQYVIARESYDKAQVQANYAKVGLWSSGTARSDYINGMQASNPASPLSRYPGSTIVDTRVKSVSPLDGNAAMVRFETIRRDAGGQLQPPEAWVAVIRYRFSAEPMRSEDRFVNPLGFQVTSYRRDQESVGAPISTAPPVVNPAPPQVIAPGASTIPGVSGTPGSTPSPAPSRRGGMEMTL